MITELSFIPFKLLIHAIIALVPEVAVTNASITGIIPVLQKGVWFMGNTMFGIVMGNVLLWWSVHLAWAVIEWIYKKIPGVE